MLREKTEDWLSRYANNYHTWRLEDVDGKRAYKRRLGLVEYSFDTDGVENGGRADMSSILTLEIRHSIASKEEFRRRIVLAWASLRLQHVLLMSRVHVDSETGQRSFVIELPSSVEDVVRETSKSIVWMEDSYPAVDAQELYLHSLNVGRIIDPCICLSRLHVLPLVHLPDGNYQLRFLTVMAHQISDGLSAYNWFSHFIRILNMSVPELERDIVAFRARREVVSRLPPAQEDLYPPVVGSKASQRWFWAIIRVLRHVRKTLPPTFVNPLRRAQRRPEALPFPPKFDKLFDYSQSSRPPMNCGHCHARLSKTASTRLIQLCKSVNVSVGAGCFALVGISMMELEEERHPDIAGPERRPFTASFPLNPRAFFGWNAPADSCMLAFSEGITIPFMPSSLPVEGRFRLMAMQANRQLRMYQKRSSPAQVNIAHEATSPVRLLATGYLFQLERVESKLPPHRKTDVNPQGAYPAKVSQFGATCGVSSVGSAAGFFRPGLYDLGECGAVQGKDFVADFRAYRVGVRARDNEFLIGSATDAAGIVGFGVSYDANAICEDAARAWATKIESLLEDETGSKL